MLTKVHFQSLKALRDVTIELGQFTVLVGPNGVGKTTVLDGIHRLLQVARARSAGGREERARELFVERWAPPHVMFPGSDSLSLSLDTGDGLHMNLSLTDYRDDYWHTIETQLREHSENVLPSDTLQQLDPAELARDSLAASGRPSLASNGAGLATVLHHMIVQRDGSIERVEAELTTIVPDFCRIRTEETEVFWVAEESIVVDGQVLPRRVKKRQAGVKLILEFANGASVRADNVSEGTLLALGLLTVIHGPQRAELILIDDLDRALHIGAQQRLVAILQAILDEHKNLQIVATTHSPDLVDSLDPSSVWVLGAGSEGTVAKCLTDHPEAEKWLGTLHTGEFWSSTGESWVTEV